LRRNAWKAATAVARTRPASRVVHIFRLVRPVLADAVVGVAIAGGGRTVVVRAVPALRTPPLVLSVFVVAAIATVVAAIATR
jgi:hypothetical protein